MSSSATPSFPAEAVPAAGALTRRCETTGFSVCLTAERFIKLHAVCAVVFLLIGGVAAIR